LVVALDLSEGRNWDTLHQTSLRRRPTELTDRF
jgi:hypothetical protein